MVVPQRAAANKRLAVRFILGILSNQAEAMFLWEDPCDEGRDPDRAPTTGQGRLWESWSLGESRESGGTIGPAEVGVNRGFDGISFTRSLGTTLI